ncbi:hypothetical protein CDD83_1757 [Cordyceps sp. RAO-2017]|nr:hypothetical protein CDD83_1757 [Cordyceps sp. RAO-2017]
MTRRSPWLLMFMHRHRALVVQKCPPSSAQPPALCPAFAGRVPLQEVPACRHSPKLCRIRRARFDPADGDSAAGGKPPEDGHQARKTIAGRRLMNGVPTPSMPHPSSRDTLSATCRGDAERPGRPSAATTHDSSGDGGDELEHCHRPIDDRLKSTQEVLLRGGLGNSCIVRRRALRCSLHRQPACGWLREWLITRRICVLLSTRCQLREKRASGRLDGATSGGPATTPTRFIRVPDRSDTTVHTASTACTEAPTTTRNENERRHSSVAPPQSG